MASKKRNTHEISLYCPRGFDLPSVDNQRQSAGCQYPGKLKNIRGTLAWSIPPLLNIAAGLILSPGLSKFIFNGNETERDKSKYVSF
jgi:hypothetical protein